jgi:hypothetical protein
VILLAIILIALLQLALIFSACFLMVPQADSGIPMALAMLTIHSLSSYLLPKLKGNRFPLFLATGSTFVTASTFAHDGHF